ncbi:hypothetical protein C8J57DRAFT_1285573 [Mycena rebaudengoi]|nr:hypothetical protein C8J57DRAFT_1285573 [Mycena rebaudengoi]
MLEIEMHSPSFRTTRSASAKRARSPDSPSERPAKRLSLAIGESLPRLPSQSAFPYFGPRSSAGTSRQSSEDWVQQAGGLSIDSPLFSALSGPTIERIAAMEESGMLVDDDASEEIPRRPYLAPLRTAQSDPFMHSGFTDSPIRADDRPPSARSYDNGPAAPPLFLPAINIMPATPDLLLSATRPTTPMRASSPTAMNISPTASFSSLGSPLSRKQRFMMGPRANCEKCRIGVKGHSVHLDQF